MDNAAPLPEASGLNIETRTIDPVPLNERHGSAWHLGPFWFTGNFVLTTMVTGFVGPALGLAAWQAVMAIIFGVTVGTLCMALHANQGPRLGLPQMLQSRAQFGLRGAVVPFAAVVCVYVGFNVFNVILATDALTTVLPGSDGFWYAVLIGAAVLITIIGHDLLHTVQRLLTYLLIGVFGLLTLAALLLLEADTVQRNLQFSWSGFFIQLSAAAGYQISYSVYVSDYSRYLPPTTSARKVVLWTYLGAAGSALWLMSLGALMASAVPAPEAISSLQHLGNQFLPGFGTFAIVMAVPALVGIMAVNYYGAMLTGFSAITAFRPMNPGLRTRALSIVGIGALVYLTAIALPESYLDSFNLFLQLMLYFLVPWSAINLTDYYLLRKGRYVVSDLFNPAGIYGQWAWPGILAYLGGLLTMLPFISLAGLRGPVAEALAGADLAFIPGFVVSALLYCQLMRRRSPLAPQVPRP
ncbi:purine-cytosine permease family protein [Pseudomonas aegrilactucae]|uniref:Cytosine permease n=1 Tax=Pseudomonas aegrilactucae TaxID=2854028 RepID=A0A9Q2XKQ6_9PSED|nr:cytosine permease [Pseudomonas aegrilactucae]MBV6288847.1 cytosine permease [Pseudomonas aegrilactucae]